jgi:hypothetical protein
LFLWIDLKRRRTLYNLLFALQVGVRPLFGLWAITRYARGSCGLACITLIGM